VTIIALPLNCRRRDAIAKLKSLWGFESELQTNPMPFHLDSHAALYSACDGLGTEQNTEGLWVKTAAQFQAVCGPKFMKFWDNVGTPCTFRRHCPIVYKMFRSEDIHR